MRKNPVYEISQNHIKNLSAVKNREALLELLPKNSVVAEIGAAEGGFSEKILKISRPQKLHLIDMWSSKRYNKKLLNLVKKKFKEQIEEQLVEIDIGLSTEVVHNYEDYYFDWIYIDTEHSYETTLAELNLYSRKVKNKGIIAGHDFVVGNWRDRIKYGVIEAVYEFCVKNNWEIIYITMEAPPGHNSYSIRRINNTQ